MLGVSRRGVVCSLGTRVDEFLKQVSFMQVRSKSSVIICVDARAGAALQQGIGFGLAHFILPPNLDFLPPDTIFDNLKIHLQISLCICTDQALFGQAKSSGAGVAKLAGRGSFSNNLIGSNSKPPEE